MPERLSIGERLPSPWYEKTQDRKHRFPYTRICTICSETFTTVDVAMVEGWTGGCCIYCPVHPEERGRVIGVARPSQIANSTHMSAAFLRIYSMGGMYRRRKCLLKSCQERWTCVELAPEGLVVDDITKCPVCGGKTKIDKSRLGIVRSGDRFKRGEERTAR